MQLASALPHKALHGCAANAKTPGNPRVLALNVGDTGFDSPHDSSGKNADRERCDAESDASAEACGDDDAGLALIVKAWPKLSADARRAMLEFVDRELGAVAAADRAR